MYNDKEYKVNIKVLGVGGGGSNTADFIVDSKLKNVETFSINTDAQALEQSRADKKIHIGKTLTKGLGAGAIPEIGKNAAEESREEIIENIEGADIIFVASGMGGGTGTGAAPYIASLAKETAKLTIAIVTKPFAFEGRSRMEKAVEGITKLNEVADITVVIPNQKLVQEHQDKYIEEAFAIPDEVLRIAVVSLIRMLNSNARVGSSIDLSTLTNSLRGKGLAVMGMGESKDQELTSTENLHIALEKATSSNILDVSIKGANQFIVLLGGNLNSINASEQNYIYAFLDQVLGYDDYLAFIAYRPEDDAPDYERSITLIATDYRGQESNEILKIEQEF